jgi:hypothetical protein
MPCDEMNSLLTQLCERERERDVLPSKCQNDIRVGNTLEIILGKKKETHGKYYK